MGQFFIKRGDKIQGPASLQQLENLRAKLKATDLIAENPNGPWTTWEQAESNLFPALESLPLADLDIPVATPPTIWQPQLQTQPKPSPQAASKKPKNNKALFIGLGVGGGIFGLLSIALVAFMFSGGSYASGKVRKDIFDNIHRKLLTLDDNSNAEQELGTEIKVAEAAADSDAEKAVVQLAKEIVEKQTIIMALTGGKKKLVSMVESSKTTRLQAQKSLEEVKAMASKESDPNSTANLMLKKMLPQMSKLDETVNELQEQASKGRAILPNSESFTKILTASQIAFVEATALADMGALIYADTNQLEVLIPTRKALVDLFGKAINGKERLPAAMLKKGK